MPRRNPSAPLQPLLPHWSSPRTPTSRLTTTSLNPRRRKISNNGFSFITIHWASFSTGLSSVLAVLVFLRLVAGCCYFRDKRQQQSRARHTEGLRHIVAGANRHSSSPPLMQSGAYPGPASASDVIHADPFVFEPVRGAVYQPAMHHSAASASCGLPGCFSKYLNVPAIQHVPVTPSAPPLAVTHELVSTHPKSLSTSIHSLGCQTSLFVRLRHSGTTIWLDLLPATPDLALSHS